MRRILALAVIAAAAAVGTAPAAADPVCRPVTSNAGVCYQLADCPRCSPEPVVDPYCSDHYQTLWCRTIDGIDSRELLGSGS